jgi:D-alanine-D-alanine ligase
VLEGPYTGSRAGACALAADKISAKRIFRSAGLPTADFFAFSESAFQSLGAGQALGRIERRLGLPIVVKPASQGSALGIKFAQSPAELPAALIAAFSYDRRVLLERFIAGRDLAVSIVEDREGYPRALPLVEAVPERVPVAHGGTGYDYESRYEIGRTRFECPAVVPDGVAEHAQRVALAAYEHLGCRGFARVDLMLEAGGGDLFLLELNPIPGLTETSLLPLAADAAGIPFDTLVQEILTSAAR